MNEPIAYTLDPLMATPYTLARLEIIEAHIPQVERFRSAVGVRHERQALFVRWVDEDGAWGLGECSCRPDPFYSGEFVDGAFQVLCHFLFPLLPARGSVLEALTAMERVRGWPFTTAALQDALFDLLRRKGIADPVDAWPGPRTEAVPVGISLGLFYTPESAVARVGQAVAAGYRRVKMKIAPQMNFRTLAAVRDAFPDLHLGFDANGSFSLDDEGLLAGLVAFEPAMLEQPFAPDDLLAHATFRAANPELRICLDESIKSPATLQVAHQLGAMDEVNIKPGRVGGMVAALEMVAFGQEAGLPAWVGGMFETGIGRWNNLRLAACLPEAHAHDLSPSSRYFSTDVVEEPVEMTEEGTILMNAGLPPAIDVAALRQLTVRKEVLTY